MLSKLNQLNFNKIQTLVIAVEVFFKRKSKSRAARKNTVTQNKIERMI